MLYPSELRGQICIQCYHLVATVSTLRGAPAQRDRGGEDLDPANPAGKANGSSYPTRRTTGGSVRARAGAGRSNRRGGCGRRRPCRDGAWQCCWSRHVSSPQSAGDHHAPRAMRRTVPGRATHWNRGPTCSGPSGVRKNAKCASPSTSIAEKKGRGTNPTIQAPQRGKRRPEGP